MSCERPENDALIATITSGDWQARCDALAALTGVAVNAWTTPCSNDTEAF